MDNNLLFRTSIKSPNAAKKSAPRIGTSTSATVNVHLNFPIPRSRATIRSPKAPMLEPFAALREVSLSFHLLSATDAGNRLIPVPESHKNFFPDSFSFT